MEIASLLRKTDYFRRSPARAGGRSGHKEWLHFCVRQNEVDVLVNFGVSDDVDSPPSSWSERGQLIVLIRHGESWTGAVERYWGSEMEIAGGEIYARLGGNTVEFTASGIFRVRVRLSNEIRVELELRPETFPSLANNISMGPSQSLSWLVVPRLRTHGLVCIGERRWSLENGLAYHDHNWGNLSWGGDFAWEWGYGTPAQYSCPWSFMFVRLSDRGMSRTKTQVLTVWRGPHLVRAFRGRELSIIAGDPLSPSNVFRVPAVMALLAPGHATEVPATLTLEGRAADDVFRVDLAARSVAQIVVPADGAPGVTRINEVPADLRATGRIHEEEIDYEGGGIFEVLAS